MKAILTLFGIIGIALLGIFFGEAVMSPKPLLLESDLSAAELNRSVKVDSSTKNILAVVGNEQERERNSVEASEQESTPDQWWKDQAFLEKAKKEYSKKLLEVYAEMNQSAKRIDGKEILRKVLQERGSLFLSDEFMLNMEQFEDMDSLDMIGIADLLSTISGNFSELDGSFAELNDEKKEITLDAMKKRPLEFPPYMLLESFSGDQSFPKNEGFTTETRELYLKYLPDLIGATREYSIGSSAAVNTLLSSGISNEDTVRSYRQWNQISPEIVAGRENEAALMANFLTDFESLVYAYYY